MSAPRVSIIIPTYNHAHFIRQAIESVINQTFGDWQAVVINNYSQDDTVDIVSSYNDNRIKIVNFSNEGIIAASRNYGLSLTSAPIVAFLDSDDVWLPNKLERCLSMIDAGYDLVCHSETWIGPADRRRIVHYGPENRATFKNLLLKGNCISTSAVVVRRNCLERVNGFSIHPDFVTAEDYELWIKLAQAGAKMGFLDDVLGEYLIHNSNSSGSVLKNMNAVMSVYKYYLPMVEKNVNKSDLRRAEALIYYTGARGLQNSRQHNQAWRFFFLSLGTYPLIIRVYIAMFLNLIDRMP